MTDGCGCQVYQEHHQEQEGRLNIDDETLRQMALEHYMKRDVPWCWTQAIRERSEVDYLVTFARAVVSHQQMMTQPSRNPPPPASDVGGLERKGI